MIFIEITVIRRLALYFLLKLRYSSVERVVFILRLGNEKIICFSLIVTFLLVRNEFMFFKKALKNG